MQTIAATFRVPSTPRYIAAALEGLTRLNMQQLRARPRPPLYKCGIRYARDVGETWDSADICTKRGYGDCEDLACWRAAELRLAGVPAKAVVVRSHTPGVAWHCVVRHANGRLEDPSRKLGM